MSDESGLVHLVVRTDEKYEAIRAVQHDLSLEQKDIRNNLDRLEKRLDFGVAVTGQKNAEELGRQAVELGKIKQTQELEQMKLGTVDKALTEKLDKISKAVDNIYRGILTIFFSTAVAGIILYGLKFFKL